MEEALVSIAKAVLEGTRPGSSFNFDSFQDEFELNFLTTRQQLV